MLEDITFLSLRYVYAARAAILWDTCIPVTVVNIG